jgi:hypothetical protein
MTVTEFFEWLAYFEYKANEEKKAMKKAESKSRSRRR